MDHEKDLLIDFETKDVEKSKYFSPLIFLSVFYIFLYYSIFFLIYTTAFKLKKI